MIARKEVSTIINASIHTYNPFLSTPIFFREILTYCPLEVWASDNKSCFCKSLSFLSLFLSFFFFVLSLSLCFLFFVFFGCSFYSVYYNLTRFYRNPAKQLIINGAKLRFNSSVHIEVESYVISTQRSAPHTKPLLFIERIIHPTLKALIGG